MNIMEILKKSAEIGMNNKFRVNIYNSLEKGLSNFDNLDLIESKEMTYIELGQYLITNNQDIEKVNIIKK